MKSTVICALAAALFLICSPLFLIKENAAATAAFSIVKPVTESGGGERKIFRIKTGGAVKKLSAEEYVTGVLCGEVSPAYEKEALKAQAVAAYTFACRRAEYAESVSRDYDLTDDPATDQCYISEADARKKWGDRADEYLSVMKSAVKEVYGERLTYGGETALTVYHALSPGITNSAEDVWGKAVPYLVPVESVGDRLSPAYLTEAEFTADELKEKLSGLCEPAAGENAFSDIKKNKSGTVLTLVCGGKELSGADAARALSLPGAAFDAEYKNGVYRFTVYGRGHGVGMSQTGAEYMAKQGCGYREILFHYYKGCEIKKS